MGKAMSLLDKTTDILSKITKLPTDIYGLKHLPTFEKDCAHYPYLDPKKESQLELFYDELVL